MGGERSISSMSQGFGVGKGTKFLLANSDSCDVLLLAVDGWAFPTAPLFYLARVLSAFGFLLTIL